jgi:hypothetical protein
MQRRVGAALALVCLLALAACSASEGDGSDGAPTVTPAEVPTDLPDDRRTTPGDPPRALLAEDPRRLSYNHAAALGDRSYTFRRVEVVTFTNGTVHAATRRTVRVAAGGVPYAATVESRGAARALGVKVGAKSGGASAPARGEFWSDGSRLYWAISRDGEAEYGTVPPNRYSVRTCAFVALARPRPSLQVYEPFRVVESWTVTESEGGFEVVGSGATERRLIVTPADVTDPRDPRLRATVTANGIVRSYRFAYTGTVDGERVRVVRTVAFDAIDRTAVERPPWLDRANESGAG